MILMRKASVGPVLAGILTLALAACDSGNTTGGNAGQGGGFGRFNQQQGVIPSVEVVRATRGTLPLEERITGRVIARNQTEIYPDAGGLIAEVFVQNGDEVNAGDPLVRLRDSEFTERRSEERRVGK